VVFHNSYTITFTFTKGLGSGYDYGYPEDSISFAELIEVMNPNRSQLYNIFSFFLTFWSFRTLGQLN